jgi:hypothetical protein
LEWETIDTINMFFIGTVFLIFLTILIVKLVTNTKLIEEQFIYKVVSPVIAVSGAFLIVYPLFIFTFPK